MSQAHAFKQNRLLGIYYRLIEIMNAVGIYEKPIYRFNL